MGTTTIETITVTRPMKVIAFTCCGITVFLMLASLGAADWVQTEGGFREGLFAQCIKKGTPTPIPFGGTPEPGCRKAHSAGYVRAAAALAVICFITDFFGTLLTGLGLRSTDPNKKYKYYRVAIYSLGVAVVCLFLAIIIYPTSMAKEMDAGDEREWGFGFGYGSAVFSLIFLVLSLVLLICDRESEEIFYKEREAEDEEGEEEKEEA
jgi:L-asparagine transporter-like permease